MEGQEREDEEAGADIVKEEERHVRAFHFMNARVQLFIHARAFHFG